MRRDYHYYLQTLSTYVMYYSMISEAYRIEKDVVPALEEFVISWRRCAHL